MCLAHNRLVGPPKANYQHTKDPIQWNTSGGVAYMNPGNNLSNIVYKKRHSLYSEEFVKTDIVVAS